MQNCKWKRIPQKAEGIICGCDCQQEWLLSWWWDGYRSENDFPVTFMDFGMSSKAQKWCAERGEVIALNLDASFIKGKEEISLDSARQWEDFYGPTVWKSRYSFFKKPFALLHSPYQKAIWIDLDCEILGSIEEIFSTCDPISQIALVREHATAHLPKFHIDGRYNGGVIGFVHGAKMIQKWAEDAVVRNQDFWSDDALLSALIREYEVPVVELSELYNWRLAKGVNVNAIIHHWVGSAGKSYIKHFGGIKHPLHLYRT